MRCMMPIYFFRDHLFVNYKLLIRTPTILTQLNCCYSIVLIDSNTRTYKHDWIAIDPSLSLNRRTNEIGLDERISQQISQMRSGGFAYETPYLLEHPQTCLPAQLPHRLARFS